MKKLNFGCGLDYKDGWINTDFNKEIKADVYCNFNKKLPFKKNEFDYVLIDNVLEHVENIFLVIDELFRITKSGGIIEIYVPHFSGIYATKHLAHFHQFGIGSFDIYKKISGLNKGFNGERYGNARFKIISQKLIYFHHNGYELPILSKIPINWVFNFGRSWQLFLEKFIPLKFDEIYFKLKIIK